MTRLKIVEEWACPFYVEYGTDEHLEDNGEYQRLSYWVVEWDEDERLITNFVEQFQSVTEAERYLDMMQGVAGRITNKKGE